MAKVKLFSLFVFFIGLLIFLLLQKLNWKENLAQNLRIYTCQPNFTIVNNSQSFKIKRLFKGFLNTLKKGCKYEVLNININTKNYEIIKSDRRRAIKNGVLTNPNKVPAIITYKNEQFKSEVRLKGELVNHWGVEKQWSLKIELKEGKSINGMKEFSITKLAVRQFPDNLIIGNQFERSGLISPNFKIYKTNINSKNWGLMLAEEQFSNVFLEKRNLKDGLVFKFTNEANFKISKYFSKKKQEERKLFIDKLGLVEVNVYNNKKINKNKHFQHQETLIKSINEKINSNINLKNKYLIVKKYFNVEKIAKLVANVVFFDSFHSLDLINVRFYLNPYNLIIEPIPTDNSYNLKSHNIIYYKKKLKGINQIFTLLYKDEVFKNTYRKTLIELKSNLKNIETDNKDFCKNFEKYCTNKINIIDLERHIKKLIEIGDDIFPIIDENKNKSKEINFSKISTDSSELDVLKIYDNYIYARLFGDYLKIYNKTLDKILLKKITFYKHNKNNKCRVYKKKNCTAKQHNIDITLKRFQKANFEKVLLNHDNKSVVWAELNGSLKNEKFEYFLRNEDKNLNKKFFSDKKLKKNEHLSNLTNNTYTISGKLVIKKPIVIPKGFNLVISSGSELLFDQNSYIYLNGGNLTIDGENKKIKLFPLKDFWRGIYVNDSNDLSKIINTEISSTRNFEHNGISLTGGINFYNSNVNIIDSSFLNSNAEDAINIINSKFKLIDSKIINTLSDALDSDFSKGLIKNTILKNIGGDAVDTSGSDVSIYDTEFFNIGDKGLSAGEKSNIYVENLKIKSARFGLVSKDLSKIVGGNIDITNSFQYDVMAFQKKMHFGPGFIKVEKVKSDNNILSQKKSTIYINNKKAKNKKFDPKKFY